MHHKHIMCTNRAQKQRWFRMRTVVKKMTPFISLSFIHDAHVQLKT